VRQVEAFAQQQAAEQGRIGEGLEFPGREVGRGMHALRRGQQQPPAAQNARGVGHGGEVDLEVRLGAPGVGVGQPGEELLGPADLARGVAAQQGQGHAWFFRGWGVHRSLPVGAGRCWARRARRGRPGTARSLHATMLAHRRRKENA
jgi:hypothetical protein